MREVVRVRVGSRNAAKLAAVRLGLSAFFERVEVEGWAADSGVPSQPIGMGEILSGARTRARRSFEPGNCDLAAGIEDGLIAVEGVPTGFLNVGFCVLYDGQEESVGLSAGFEYPPACVRAATSEQRIPIGDAFDAVFRTPVGWTDPGPRAGNIGRLTAGKLTRDEYGAQAVICAYVRRLHPALYRGQPA